MPDETQTQSLEKPKPNLAHRAKKAGAVVASTLAFAGPAAPAAHAKQPVANSPKPEMINPRLRDPHELPGLKTHLGAEALRKIQASTVEVAVRGKAYDSSYLPGNYSARCTAVKVSIPGQKDPFIMTAAHCLGEIIGVKSGAFANPLAPADKAENFTASSPIDIAVVDPQASTDARLAQPTATIDRISIDTSNRDVALLHPVPEFISPKASTDIRRFADIPAIPLKVAAAAPLQGTPVALYGEPQANNFEGVGGTGVYVGRVTLSEALPQKGGGPMLPATLRQLDLVGINPASPETDNCNYGTSGSMALLPNGQLLGNLSIRTTKGYWALLEGQPWDYPAFFDYWRPIWEKQLNVDLSGFEVLCGYTVLDSTTPHDLLAGYNHPAPVIAQR